MLIETGRPHSPYGPGLVDSVRIPKKINRSSSHAFSLNGLNSYTLFCVDPVIVTEIFLSFGLLGIQPGDGLLV